MLFRSVGVGAAGFAISSAQLVWDSADCTGNSYAAVSLPSGAWLLPTLAVVVGAPGATTPGFTTGTGTAASVLGAPQTISALGASDAGGACTAPGTVTGLTYHVVGTIDLSGYVAPFSVGP